LIIQILKPKATGFNLNKYTFTIEIDTINMC
jgi:hypothetical protein